MCMINEMNGRIKDLEQQLQEKDVALSGLQAKINGLVVRLSVSERQKAQLNDQAKTIHLVAHKLRLPAGVDVTTAVPALVTNMIAEWGNITKHAVHAAKCQLINDIQAAYVPYDKLTAEQVISLICAEKETVNEA